MKRKFFQTGLNLLLLTGCATLIIVYLLRLPLSLPETAERIEPAQRQPEQVPASNLGLIGPAEPLAAADVIPFVKTLHIHGIPYEQARQFGPEAVPILLDLLADPENAPYATNIVVTLGFMGYPSARQPLLDYLTQTQGEVSLEQYRALTSVPYALSQLAHQGDVSALTFLLQASDPGYWNGSRLPWTYNGQAQSLELYRQVLLGLGVSGLPQAQTRLAEIATQGSLSAQADNEALQQALALNQRVQQEGMAPVVSPDPNSLAAPAELQNTLDAQANDTNSSSHLQTFTVGRHVAMGSIPSDAQVDALLNEASRVMQTADSGADISCCVSFQRSGSVGTFNVTDGIIRTSSELNQIFGLGSYQVKIVPSLDYCGGLNTSIIGCAFINNPKNMILEYSGSATRNGILWAHEFGHNQGLEHPDELGGFPTRIMNAILYVDDSKQMTQSECNAWHNTLTNPGQVIGPCPALFTVSKLLEASSVVTSGATINYTILIENNTFNAITGITVSDALPTKFTYVPGSATASPPIVNLTNFPTTTGSFTLASNSSVQITYAVNVGVVNSKEVLVNTVTVNASGLAQPIQASYTAIVDPVLTYLPIVFK